MGLIRPLFYLAVGFVAGNLYNSCTKQDNYERMVRPTSSLEERIDKIERMPVHRLEYVRNP